MVSGVSQSEEDASTERANPWPERKAFPLDLWNRLKGNAVSMPLFQNPRTFPTLP